MFLHVAPFSTRPDPPSRAVTDRMAGFSRLEAAAARGFVVKEFGLSNERKWKQVWWWWGMRTTAA